MLVDPEAGTADRIVGAAMSLNPRGKTPLSDAVRQAACWLANAGYDQVTQVPVGGADTGVTVEESSSVSGLALGGMALVAAAGATFMVRRRVQA